MAIEILNFKSNTLTNPKIDAIKKAIDEEINYKWLKKKCSELNGLKKFIGEQGLDIDVRKALNSSWGTVQTVHGAKGPQKKDNEGVAYGKKTIFREDGQRGDRRVAFEYVKDGDDWQLRRVLYTRNHFNTSCEVCYFRDSTNPVNVFEKEELDGL